jgi:hypothetical protein
LCEWALNGRSRESSSRLFKSTRLGAELPKGGVMIDH